MKPLLILISIFLLILICATARAAVTRIHNNSATTNAVPSVEQAGVSGLPAALAGKAGTNEARAVALTNLANQFQGMFIGATIISNKVGAQEGYVNSGTNFTLAVIRNQVGEITMRPTALLIWNQGALGGTFGYENHPLLLIRSGPGFTNWQERSYMGWERSSATTDYGFSPTWVLGPAANPDKSEISGFVLANIENGSVHRFIVIPTNVFYGANGFTEFTTEGTGAHKFNTGLEGSGRAGTGGVEFGSGGSSPTITARITAAGVITANGSGLTNLPITALQGSGGAGTAATQGTAGLVLKSAANGGVFWAAGGGYSGWETNTAAASAFKSTNNISTPTLTNSGNLQTATLNTTGNATVGGNLYPGGFTGAWIYQRADGFLGVEKNNQDKVLEWSYSGTLVKTDTTKGTIGLWFCNNIVAGGDTQIWRPSSGHLAVSTNLSAVGSITATNGVVGAMGSSTMSTGVVSVATSASTNLFTGWSYTTAFGDIGMETNSSFVITNARSAGQVVVSFGAAIAGANGNLVSVHIYTNHVRCSLLWIEANTLLTAYETTFKEFALPALAANTRVSLFIGNGSAASVNVKNACLNVKGAN